MVVLLVGLVTVLAAAGGATLLTERRETDGLAGVVVGPAGAPVAGAEVTGPDGNSSRTDAGGRFQLGGDAGWLTASAAGYLPRSRAGLRGRDTLIRLAPDSKDTVSLAFGGDVMFGRRYYDQDEDGTLDGLLRPDSSAAEHARLLEPVAPLLAGADIATVNLETPLVERPYYDPTKPRPRRFHPTKDFAFASAPAAATALRDVGVDVVGIANNHLYDALDRGVASTRSALAGAGFGPRQGFFGAGAGPRAAWEPAYHDVRGVRVAFLGCTTILGEEHSRRYVAGPDQGGAAACRPARLARAVRAADRAADAVVVSIHGGYEYGRDPSAQIRRLSDLATASGATLVVNHHPHVVGGLKYDSSAGGGGGQLTAWTLGNLLFDQTVWPTFDSYVLQVAVRAGKVVSAWVEPIRLQDYKPTAATGDDADWVVRGTEARSEGPWVVDDGSLWLDTAGAARRATDARGTSAASGTATAGVGAGGLARIDRGCAPGAGREVLWTGGFEAGDLTRARGVLWNARTATPYRKVDRSGARTGEAGVLLQRGSANSGNVQLSVDHRVLVQGGDELTLLLSTRARFGNPDTKLQVSWYNDTRGASQARTLIDIPASEDWQTSRVDLRVPENAVAVQPFVSLAPPETGVSQLAVDDVAMIDWSTPGCDYTRTPGAVSDDALAPMSPAPAVTPVQAESLTATAPSRIAPGPEGTTPSGE
ncbi:CapA family protein [Nocardioides aurantiacus]|uniref:CapA family protein n=1 Tax=Nocardioides aurantiacus TaxID=86796 RepID=UPI00403F0A17